LKILGGNKMDVKEKEDVILSPDEIKRKEFIAELQLKILEMETLRFFIEQKIDKEAHSKEKLEDSQKAERFIGRVKKLIDEGKKLISVYTKEITYEDFFHEHKKKIVLINLQGDILKSEIYRDLLKLVVDYYISEKGRDISEFQSNLENIENRFTYFINYKKKKLDIFKGSN
jgi:hypothetical protein